MEEENGCLPMTSFDFAYYRPDTLNETIECYNNLVSGNQSVLYYGGGTEIISMARAESIKFDDLQICH